MSARGGSGGAAKDRRYRVEPARPEHVPALPAVEEAAATLFSPQDLPPEADDPGVSPESFARAQAEGRLWVALAPDGAPVGFALVQLVDGAAHLEEMDVHPDHGRRGLGSRLAAAAVAWARAQSLPALTLTTFAHVPWNAPFYARLGFRELAPGETGPGLAAILRRERERGLRHRLAMRLALGDAGPPG